MGLFKSKEKNTDNEDVEISKAVDPEMEESETEAPVLSGKLKIVIVSDTHGHLENFSKMIAREKPFDMLIHCGDICGDEKIITDLAGCPCHMVAGNMDFYTCLPGLDIFEIGRHKIFLCHGHHYYVDGGTDFLALAAKQDGCDIAMFGHTHRPLIEKRGDVTIINPGSISKPRTFDNVYPYIVMETDTESNADPVFTLKKIDDYVKVSLFG